MNASELDKSGPSAGARAQAAAWVARLHGPNRTAQVEEGLRRWMADDPQHAAAFELATDAWEKSARLRRRPLEQVASWERPGFRMSFSRVAFATVAVAALAVISTVFYLRNDAVATAVGERRVLALEDGTRVYLNTDSRAVVSYDKKARRVQLDKGEALFEVAKRPDWPFIVSAGDRQIQALGTAFIVRREQRNLSVTLVEGKVTVAPTGADITAAPLSTTRPRDQEAASERSASEHAGTPAVPERENPAGAGERSGAELNEVVTLAPGQRLSFISGAPPQIDRPPLDKLTAWQRGQVALDDTPLSSAIAEMNRYSNVRIVLGNDSAARIRVSGVFTAGDSANFAQAVARTYGLQVVEHPREIVLAGEPLATQATGGAAVADDDGQ